MKLINVHYTNRKMVHVKGRKKKRTCYVYMLTYFILRKFVINDFVFEVIVNFSALDLFTFILAFIVTKGLRNAPKGRVFIFTTALFTCINQGTGIIVINMKKKRSTLSLKYRRLWHAITILKFPKKSC